MKFTKEEIIKAARHAVLVVVFALVITATTTFAAPTTKPGETAVPTLLSADGTAQAKVGAFGSGIVNMAQFTADTSKENGVTLETQGKASLGPTAIFGDLYVGGATITLGGLKNTTSGVKQLCIDQSSHVVMCP